VALRRLTERLDRLAPRSTPDSLQLIPGNTRLERDLLGNKEVPADAAGVIGFVWPAFSCDEEEHHET